MIATITPMPKPFSYRVTCKLSSEDTSLSQMIMSDCHIAAIKKTDHLTQTINVAINKYIEETNFDIIQGVIYTNNLSVSFYFTMNTETINLFDEMYFTAYHKCMNTGTIESMTMDMPHNPDKVTEDTQTLSIPKIRSILAHSNNDDMTLEEFKIIASERLEGEQIRTDSVVIDFEATEETKTIYLTELLDNQMATAYIKRFNAYVETEGTPSIKVVDDFKGQNKTIYESISGDTFPAFSGIFANKIIVSGTVKGQIIIYTAERSS